jgi:hypothetical protein
MNPYVRWLVSALAILGTLLLMAWVGYGLANSHPTAEKVNQYAQTTDLARLSGPARAEALDKLQNLINNLSWEERKKWRREGAWKKWLDAMTESEKSRWLEATMPSGFKQWLAAFDELPEESRRKFVEDLLQHLKDNHELITDWAPGESTSMYGTNEPPNFSPELAKKKWTLGLKTAYMESSAETKAEWAPLLEELQSQMQSGQLTKQ